MPMTKEEARIVLRKIVKQCREHGEHGFDYPRYCNLSDHEITKLSSEFVDAVQENFEHIRSWGEDYWIEHTLDTMLELGEIFMADVLSTFHSPIYVWVVKRNVDMTEGRGPMVLDSIWVDNKVEVAKYIDCQEGVMGRRAKWSEMDHGDWTMERVELKNSYAKEFSKHMEKVRKKALQKLTDEEREALGLGAKS